MKIRFEFTKTEISIVRSAYQRCSDAFDSYYDSVCSIFGMERQEVVTPNLNKENVSYTHGEDSEGAYAEFNISTKLVKAASKVFVHSVNASLDLVKAIIPVAIMLKPVFKRQDQLTREMVSLIVEEPKYEKEEDAKDAE